MGLMVFSYRNAIYGGTTSRMARRGRRSLTLDYDYVWNGRHVVGTFTSAAARTAGGAWSGNWVEHYSPNRPVPWRSGCALLVESSIGRFQVFAGSWGYGRRPGPYQWMLIV